MFCREPRKISFRVRARKSYTFILFKKNSFHQSVPIGTSKAFLTTILEHFATGTEMVAHCLEEVKKTWKFSKLHFFLNASQWTCRMPFWQSCEKIFAWGPKLFLRCESAKKMPTFQKKQISWNCFSGPVECIFENHVKS